MKWVNFSNTFYENFLEPEKGNFEIFLICFSRKSLISHYKRAMCILIDANKIANKKHSKLQVGYSAASANKKDAFYIVGGIIILCYAKDCSGRKIKAKFGDELGNCDCEQNTYSIEIIMCCTGRKTKGQFRRL